MESHTLPRMALGGAKFHVSGNAYNCKTHLTLLCHKISHKKSADQDI